MARKAVVLAVLAAVAAVLLWDWWRHRPVEGMFNGYVEGETQYFASPVAARLDSLGVVRGGTVSPGEVLFALDSAGVQADLEQAKARRDLAQANLERADQLKGGGAGAIAARDYDAVLAEARQASATVAGLEHTLAQMAPVAVEGGVVENTFFNPGEWVGANVPVVAVLAPRYLKVRFFVPEDQLATVRPGVEAEVACDGCQPVAVKVNFVAPQAEYTPPVLYTRQQRDRLVFLAEAVPVEVSAAALLRPGMPVEVRFQEPGTR